MKKILLVLIAATALCRVSAQQEERVPSWARETKEQKAERMAWWTHDRFGMFIHWGLYSLPARHEWVKQYERISDENYNRYFEYFNPDLYNPKQWAAYAKAAGVKYMVVTTKHHEGFCMWDTKYTDFKVTNTPYGKDLIGPLVEAFRAEGIRVGFYYSLIDWHHPDFTYDRQHPNGPRDPKERAEANKSRDMDKYRQYMKNQLTELLTQYGQIDELFLDFSYPGKDGKGHEDWDSEGLIKLARELQPQIIINNRSDLQDTSWGWDFLTPEQYIPYEGLKINGESVPWEMCQTFDGRSWGYSRDGQTWKSARQLIVMLIEAVSKGGNLLLNVGPTARGEFEPRAVERLEAIAEWMKYHSRSIYGCTHAPAGIEAPNNCLLTYNPETNRLYVHVLEWPFKSLHLPGLEGKIKYAQLLNDASEMTYYSRTAANAGEHTVEISRVGDLIMPVPVRKPDVEVPVIEIMLK